VSKSIIAQAAVLRGKGEFKSAIELIENNMSAFDDHIKVVARLQAFYAAVEMGDEVKARSLAHEIKNTDPLLPSIQSYL
jgi:hypothetical protein